VTPVFGRLRQENLKFQSCLGYVSTEALSGESQKKKKKKKETNKITELLNLSIFP
jgi:hypothetical protein